MRIHLSNARFGWINTPDSPLPSDFARIKISSQDMYWQPLQQTEEERYRHANPKAIQLTRIAIPTESLTQKVAKMLKRSSIAELSNAGSAYIVTPFKAGDRESQDYVLARIFLSLLAQSVYRLDKPYYQASETEFPHNQHGGYVDLDKNGTTTYKVPHFDLTDSLLGLLIGPTKAVSGGWHELMDPIQYLQTYGIRPAELFETTDITNYARVKSHYTEALRAFASYHIEPDPNNIGILLINNIPAKGGVVHGATPVTLLSEDSERYVYRVYVPDDITNRPNGFQQALKIRGKLLKQFLESEGD